jgi:Ca2+-binding EF-hand superfamily protein
MEKKDFDGMFDSADGDKDGYLTEPEFVGAFTLMGLNSDHFQQSDTDQDGKLSRDEAWSLATKWYPAIFQR